MNSSEWFKTIKIDEKTYCFQEYLHDEETNSYLLIGKTYAILIDTGMGVASIKNEVGKLTSLPIKVITTHAHWDHIGCHKEFNDIGIHPFEANWLTSYPFPLKQVKDELLKTSKSFPNEFKIENYSIYQGSAGFLIENNEIFDLDGRKLLAIHTPGHSPGSICIYDITNKYLFSGDVIYKGELDCYYKGTNPYDYYKSLEKLLDLDIKKIYPGHHEIGLNNMVKDVYKAFDELYKENKLLKFEGLYNCGDFSIRFVEN